MASILDIAPAVVKAAEENKEDDKLTHQAVIKAGRVKQRLTNKINKNKKTLEPQEKEELEQKVKDINKEMIKSTSAIDAEGLNQMADEGEGMI